MDLYRVRKQLNMGIPLSSINLRVTYYSRVSTDHLEQKSSLKNQIEHFDEMINGNKNWIYVKGYIDDGISGTIDYKRDNFMKMIEDAHNDKFDLIITKEISRFSRNTLDSIKYTRELLSCGVAVLFINDNINTVLPDSELRLTIMASMAQDEIRRLSERVKFGMMRSIKNGNILGNNLLYGYKKDKETGKLVIIEEEAINVRRLFNMYAIENMSFAKISKIFNQEGIKTCQNKKWSSSTLSRMIRNPKYKGYYCARKTEVIDYISKKVKKNKKEEWIMYEDKKRIPNIICEELWDRANKRLESRSMNVRNNKELYKNRYPLSAKIYCDNCKAVFYRRKQLKSGNDITWLCSKYLQEGKKVCNSPNIRESEIYNIINEILIRLKIDLSNVTKILLNLYKKNKVPVYYNNSIELKELIDIKLKSNLITNKLIELLINKIVISKINNKINHLKLEVYLNFIPLNIKLMTMNYTYKRNYNSNSLKKYTIQYNVAVCLL